MITLAQFKAHLRVTHSDEDTLIQTYLDAASNLIDEYLQVDSSGAPDEPPVDAAILLLGADLYLNRERQLTSNVLNENSTYTLLLAPYRCLEVQ